MRQWELQIAIDRRRQQPLFLQLAEAIADDIRHGRLGAGEALPGSRELARCLRVNRNTVVAGYAELVAEGWVRTRSGGGTFVADLAADPAFAGTRTIDRGSRRTAAAPAAATSVATLVPRPGALMLSAGIADPRLFPARQLARAFRRAIERRGRALLADADPCGHSRLRGQLAAMLTRTRGLAVGVDNILVTHSIEQAIDLTARAFVTPGDAVGVEAYGYPPAWNVLKLAGARLLPIPLDDAGLDVDALERLLAHERLRAVFLTPHHQFPTATVMAPARRACLGELAARHRFVIIEDDYDHEFHYDGEPVLPIASGAARADTVYLGSLSNLLAPGMHTAFAVAPAPLFERLAHMRAASDPRSDVAVECAIAELFEDGELLRHMRRARRLYALRRDAFAAALSRHLGGALDFRVPAGGMALWARADDTIDLPAWAAAGADEGVQFSDASRYDFLRRDRSSMRLGFSYHDEAELTEAVRRMARALVRSRSHRMVVAVSATPQSRSTLEVPEIMPMSRTA